MFQKKNKESNQLRRRPERNNPSAVFSYYSNRSPRENDRPRLEQPKRTFKWHLLPSYIAAAVIIGCLLYISTLEISPRLQHTGGSSAIFASNDVYEQRIQQILAQSLFTRSKLLINTKKLESEIKHEFPELADVSITVPLVSRRPIVSIETAQPTLLLTARNGSFIIDERGNALANVASVKQADNLRLVQVNDESGLMIEAGKAALPSATISFIKSVDAQLQAKNVEVESYTLPAIANELHLKVKGEGYIVKFNLQGDSRLQSGAYLAVRDQVKPAEYIDVRVEDKVFVK